MHFFSSNKQETITLTRFVHFCFEVIYVLNRIYVTLGAIVSIHYDTNGDVVRMEEQTGMHYPPSLALCLHLL